MVDFSDLTISANDVNLPADTYLPAHTRENKGSQEVEVNYFQHFELKRYGKAI